MKKYLGLDFSGACCAWSFMVNEGFEFDNTLRLISYGSFDFKEIEERHKNDKTWIIEGHILNKIKSEVSSLLSKLEPDIILLEDIFAQSVTGYKRLSKVQGAVLQALASNRLICPNTQLIMKLASEVRAPYKLSLYKPHFMESLDRNKLQSKLFRERIASLKQPKKKKLSWYRKAWKFVKKYFKNAVEHEFDLAKKNIIIEFVNNRFGLKLDYADNDIADAILLSYYIGQLDLGVIVAPKKVKKKRKTKAVKK